MHFGRTAQFDEIDCSLPPNAPGTEKLLKSLQRKGKPQIFVGCPLWADAGYVGKLYPKGTKAANFLTEYCKQFNSIEVNATGYNVPPLSTIRKWKEAATPGFQFCPKFPQSVSHRRDIHKQTAAIDQFLSAMYELGEQLGVCFLQLPPHFSPKRKDELYRFVAQMPRDLKLAVELRHADWFRDEKVKKEVFDVLEKHHTTAIITDTAGRRDVIHQRLTSDTAFIRYTGNDLHPTDYQRLDAWNKKLTEWIDKGLKSLYFYLHSPKKFLSASMGRYMIEQLNRHKEIALPVPFDYSVQQPKLL